MTITATGVDVGQPLAEWADEYGPVYRFRLGTRDALLVADVDAAHTMLRQRPDRFRRSRHRAAARPLGSGGRRGCRC